MLLNVKEAGLKLLISLLGLLDEVTDFDELSLILRLSTDTVLHVGVSSIDVLDSVTAPNVDLSQNSLFSLESLAT